MKDTSNHITVRISNAEFNVIKEITINSNICFGSNQINDSEWLLSFESIDKASELDELIKEKLVSQGFE
ncbi:MAG TPA: hypothetical protein VFM18_09770, partial [Methanosarcina sp.]|nr:hypothetical protein [Methanosarcina sp.]